jgi:ABC-type sugar transport system ATPase subunit
MLHVTDLSFRHGERVLFDRAGAAISDGWKVGLVGRNGAGKSTLLKLIQGEYEADGGDGDRLFLFGHRDRRLTGRPAQQKSGPVGPLFA